LIVSKLAVGQHLSQMAVPKVPERQRLRTVCRPETLDSAAHHPWIAIATGLFDVL